MNGKLLIAGLIDSRPEFNAPDYPVESKPRDVASDVFDRVRTNGPREVTLLQPWANVLATFRSIEVWWLTGQTYLVRRLTDPQISELLDKSLARQALKLIPEHKSNIQTELAL